MATRISTDTPSGTKGKWFWLVLAWMFVGIPLLWGVSQTLIKALALFR